MGGALLYSLGSAPTAFIIGDEVRLTTGAGRKETGLRTKVTDTPVDANALRIGHVNANAGIEYICVYSQDHLVSEVWSTATSLSVAAPWIEHINANAGIEYIRD